MPVPRPESVSSDPTNLKSWRAKLHRWLVRRLRNPDAADDVAQEVFLRLAGKDEATFVEKPLAYLYGIAFHVIHERNSREPPEVVDSEIVEEAGDDLQYAHPDEYAERLNLQRQLEAALNQLPPLYRTVLLLCKRDGMTYEEAAAASGLSVHTVEKYLIRARAQLMALTWDR